MFKKLSVILLAALMLTLSACGKENVTSTAPEAEAEPVAEQVYINPLTGREGVSKEISENRAVAIMINNIKPAQAVQTGLPDADIIYETEVEGGITRLMAVFQDVKSVPLIGTVRSCRYPYIDLANGHNAVYIHEGQDPNYAKPHLKDIDHISLENAGLGKRMSNGLSSEHTLYTEGEKLWEGIKDEGFTTKIADQKSWLNFTSEEISYEETPATSISVPFSTSYVTGFTYDSQSQKYTRLTGGSVWDDYKTGETVKVKNVFVLLTKISDYPDGKHRKVDLTSGDGYYATNGTYTFIKWSKGDSKNGFTFTDTEGNPLDVNIGNSYVCIADQGITPSFQ